MKPPQASRRINNPEGVEEFAACYQVPKPSAEMPTDEPPASDVKRPVLLRIGLIIKAFDALFEIAGGALLFYPRSFSRWVMVLTQHELVRRHTSPHMVAVVQHRAAHAIYGASIAAALYLIAHGIAKIIFIGGVMRQKKWGYVGLVGILIFFTALELGRSVLGGGWALFLFGLFDGYLAYLVWVEYRKEMPERKKQHSRRRSHRQAKAA